MAGLPDRSDNPIVSGNYGASGDQSMEIALATKLQAELQQPMADVESALVNRDFEGDFFKLGDSVAIAKPDISAITIKTGKISVLNQPGKPLVDGSDLTAGTYNDKDARCIPENLRFTKSIMVIDTYKKYAFYVSDVTKTEGKWNYESLGLALTSRKMRREHNQEVIQAVVNNASVPTVGTAANPITVANGDELYKNVILPIFSKLYNNGAITADGQITYGSNPETGHATHGAVFVPTAVYTALLASSFLQDRSTVAADEKVESGKFKTLMGLDFAIEPSLDLDNADISEKITVENAAEGTMVIVAGTKNLVTRAGKVLPPEKIRSHRFFADEFHGMEIYGETVQEPKAGVVAYVKLGE